MPLESLPYLGTLPPSFFAIADRARAGQPGVAPPEAPALLIRLFELEAPRHDIILYTDHQHLRLAGLFPHGGDPTTAYFGFWEVTPDAPADLQAAAFARLAADAAQRGFTRVVGPLNFNTFHAYRLRLGAPPAWDWFDREPTNPPAYPALLEALGFRPALTFESRLIDTPAVPAVYAQKQPLLDALAGLPFEFLPLTPALWAAREAELFALIDAIFGQNPAYRAISPEQFRLQYPPTYAARLCPYASTVVRDPATGALVALSLCHPNYAPLRLPPDEAPDFQRHYPLLPHPRTLLIKTVGVHPAYRQQGLMSFLGAYGMVHFRAHYEQAIFCLMRADNPSLRFTAGLPHRAAHYALYEAAVSG